jgi:pyrroloquinoline quinone (PQQ) biosynthesis protein C
MEMARLSALRGSVAEQLTGTRVARQLFDGSLARELYVDYLINVHYYARFSPILMAAAAARCTTSNEPLSLYLLHHADEEMGHERWAYDDLRVLGADDAAIRAGRPVTSCQALVGLTHYVAYHDNPIGLFGWMYVLESVGSDLGPAVGDELRKVFGLTDGGVKFVEGHGVNDAEHAADLEEKIATHVTEAADAAAVEQVAETVVDLYVRMFREIGGEEPSWS